jgi:hypothetical protein
VAADGDVGARVKPQVVAPRGEEQPAIVGILVHQRRQHLPQIPGHPSLSGEGSSVDANPHAAATVHARVTDRLAVVGPATTSER